MSPEKKRAMIKRDHPKLSIIQQCKLVRLSRSAFYSTPLGIGADTLVMMKEIDRVFTKYPFFHCPAGDCKAICREGGGAPDRRLSASGRDSCRAASRQAIDGEDGP